MIWNRILRWIKPHESAESRCERIGHDLPNTVKKWVDEKARIVRATEQCRRCGYTYDWEPFYVDEEGAKPYTKISESGEYLA